MRARSSRKARAKSSSKAAKARSPSASSAQGFRYLTLGFDPFPYLGRDNLPMSIFTLNLLDWFFESQGERGQATGDANPAGQGRRRRPHHHAAWAKNCRENQALTISAALFFKASINCSATASRSASPVTCRIEANPTCAPRRPSNCAVGVGRQRETSALFAFWPYLLIVSLILLMLEWFINPRMRSYSFWRLGKPAAAAIMKAIFSNIEFTRPYLSLAVFVAAGDLGSLCATAVFAVIVARSLISPC